MLQHRLGQDLRPQTTAHLAQTMALLQLTTVELETTLLNVLNANPALELVEELRCPTCGKHLVRLPCPTCAAPRADEAPVVYLSPRQASSGGRAEAADQPDAYEPRARERLDEHILRQIAPALRVSERPIAAYLLARLDDDGLLPENPAEVASYLRAPLSAVERVLDLIQHADPPGVGARTPAESLLIQLDSLCDSAAPHLLALAHKIIAGHFGALAHRDYAGIARALGTSAAHVARVGQFIQRNLTPFPARAFWGDGKLPEANEAAYRDPDMIISQLRREASSSLMVEVLTPFSGWLRVNPELKAALADCESQAEREKWSRAVEQAALMTKCLQQRNHTLRRLMEIVAVEQREFILGDDGDSHPLTRSHVARALGVHESTISRAVAGKSVALPNGRIVPLAKFFDRSLSVRDRVRVIVEAEARPLTDDEIATRLADDGVHVARRTVAKYRHMLGILPANLRVGRGAARAHPQPAYSSGSA